MNIYKVHNEATGEFYSGGNYGSWSTVGKIYTTLSHARRGVTSARNRLERQQRLFEEYKDTEHARWMPAPPAGSPDDINIAVFTCEWTSTEEYEPKR